MVDVVVVGSCNTDLTAYVHRLPAPGETIHGTKFMVGFGGKGANQCVMSAKLGAKTAMVGKIGTDSFGADTVKNFQAVGVNVDHLLTTDQAATGVAPITVDENGQNSIIVVNGANDLLTVEEVHAARPLLENAKVLVCQLEVKREVTLAALKLGRDCGIRTIFNPAPAQADLDPEFFSVPDIICLNETETGIVVGVEPTNEATAVVAAKKLQSDLGCNDVLITMGKQGCFYLSKAGQCSYAPVESVKAVDTSGAGDCFLGAMAFYIANYPDLAMADMLERSNQIAAMSVQKKGTQLSYPTKSEMPAALLEAAH